MNAPTPEQKAELEAANEKRKREIAQQQKQQQQTGSATTPRSRNLTGYFIFIFVSEDDDGEVWLQVGRVEARRPADALTRAREDDLVPDDATSYVAVPESSWHVFKPTLAFEEVN